jgi:hypothetical protein
MCIKNLRRVFFYVTPRTPPPPPPPRLQLLAITVDLQFHIYTLQKATNLQDSVIVEKEQVNNYFMSFWWEFSVFGRQPTCKTQLGEKS